MGARRRKRSQSDEKDPQCEEEMVCGGEAAKKPHFSGGERGEKVHATVHQDWEEDQWKEFAPAFNLKGNKGTEG